MSDERATWATELREANRPPYGHRRRWGPYYRQAGRFVGRMLERFGGWLEMWSWGWGP